MPLDAIPPDQRAVVQLILQQGKTYDDLATLLRTDVGSVRSRAHAALGSLAPAGATLASPDEAAELADYLLGQQSVTEREDTRDHLVTSPQARAWARVVAAELAPIARDPLPDIPEEGAAPTAPSSAPEPASAPISRPRAPRPPSDRESSRLGGALLLGVLGLALAGLIVFGVTQITGDDDDDGGGGSTQTQTSTEPQILAQVNLLPTREGSNTAGIAQVVRQGNSRAMLFAAQGVQRPRENQAYALWLYNSPSDAVRLGYIQNVPENGRPTAVVQPLPSEANRYRNLIMTRERGETERPGTIVIRGEIDLRS